MPKKPTIHFILKKSKSKESLIMTRCRYYGTDIYVSTKEYISLDKWDKKAERCIVAEHLHQTDREKRNHRRINKLLDNIRLNFLDMVDGLEYSDLISDKNSCVNSIKSRIEDFVNGGFNPLDPQILMEIERMEITPTKFFKKCVEEKANQWIKRTNTKVANGTVVNNQSVLKRFIEFMKWANLPDSFAIFDKTFENKFREYHLIYKEYAPNTFAHSNSILKTWLEQAKEVDLIKDHSYKKWQTKAATPLKVYLTQEELDKIYSLNPTDDELAKAHLKSDNLMETRDLFIIAANTGLRYSDLTHLNDGIWNLDERTLKIFQQKTHQEVELPLNKILIEIYKKYEGKLPVPIVKSHYNNQIRALAKMADINEIVSYQKTVGGGCVVVQQPKYELITSHTARRSFATNLYLALGNASIVMKFTGHKSETTFMDYICVTAKEARMIMQKQYEKIEEYYMRKDEEYYLTTLEALALDGVELPF